MNRSSQKHSFWILILLMAVSVGAAGQAKNQLWLDYQVDYPFANRYLLEVTGGYQTLLTNQSQDKWWGVNLTPTFEYSALPRMDLTFDLPLAYTLQKINANSFDVSPMAGFRFHVTQNRRLDIRILMRYQYRSFHEIEAEVWENSNRTRIKAEAFFSINGPNLFTDNLWTAFADYEEFYVLDQQVNERYANRRRARTGIGYRLNYKHRFEISYTLQYSRDEINGGFYSDNNVIQLKYKMFLNPAGIAQPVGKSTDQ